MVLSCVTSARCEGGVVRNQQKERTADLQGADSGLRNHLAPKGAGFLLVAQEDPAGRKGSCRILGAGGE